MLTPLARKNFMSLKINMFKFEHINLFKYDFHNHDYDSYNSDLIRLIDIN